MKFSFLLIMGFLAMSVKLKAQDELPAPQAKIDICKEVQNTYQIVVTDTKMKFAISEDLCETVKRERLKDKTILFKVNDTYSLKIYSEEEIPSLKLPLEYIIYIKN